MTSNTIAYIGLIQLSLCIVILITLQIDSYIHVYLPS